MELFQRNIYGDVIPEASPLLLVCLVIDSSGTMGGFPSERVEIAVNTFFRCIGASKDVDDLVEVCVYESYDELEFLGGFEKASTFALNDLRYGGSWQLPNAVVQILRNLMDYSAILRRNGRVHARPVCIVISDNPVSEDCCLYKDIDILVSEAKEQKEPFPRFIYVSREPKNHFAHHLPETEFIQAGRETLNACMLEIAQEFARSIRSRQMEHCGQIQNAMEVRLS